MEGLLGEASSDSATAATGVLILREPKIREGRALQAMARLMFMSIEKKD